jgi:hypothetical protein
MPSATSNRTLATRLININRIVFLAIVGIVAVGLDMAGLPLLGISTVSQAFQPFLVLVIGGYLGLTGFDLLWNHFYGT